MIVGDDGSEPGGPREQADPPAMTATVHRVGDVALVEVSGEVDLLTAPRLRETVFAALEGRPPVLVIDLLAVSFFGSAGLAALIEAQQRAGEQCEIRLVASGPATLRPLQATGLSAMFVICAGQTEALDPPPARIIHPPGWIGGDQPG